MAGEARCGGRTHLASEVWLRERVREVGARDLAENLGLRIFIL